jgi:hypothetical protein
VQPKPEDPAPVNGGPKPLPDDDGLGNQQLCLRGGPGCNKAPVGTWQDYVDNGKKRNDAREAALAKNPREDAALPTSQISDLYKPPFGTGRQENLAITDSEFKFKVIVDDLQLDKSTKFTDVRLASKPDTGTPANTVHRAAYSTSGNKRIVVTRDVNKNFDLNPDGQKWQMSELTWKGNLDNAGTQDASKVDLWIQEDITNGDGKAAIDKVASDLGITDDRMITVENTPANAEAIRGLVGNPNGVTESRILESYAKTSGRDIARIHVWRNVQRGGPPGLYYKAVETVDKP